MKKSIPALVIMGVMLCKTSLAQDNSVVVPAAYDSAIKRNYVRTWDAYAPEDNPNVLISRSIQDVKQTTQYFDGLGRPLQTIYKKASLIAGSSSADIVIPIVYDSLGRQIRKYLPFVANSYGGNSSLSDGNFKFNPFAQQQYFYSDNNSNSPIVGQAETYYYGKVEFEASPLNRPERIYAPGNTWVHDGKGIKFSHSINTTLDSIRIWKVTNSASLGVFGTYSCDSLYHAGELYKEITVDENNKQSIEFKDKSGLLILKKQQFTATADTGTGKGYNGWICVYYIYDNLRQLRGIVQPRGVELLAANSWNIASLSGAILNEQSLRYEYDYRGRVVMKKVPGAGVQYIVYDLRDRVVLTQDSVNRAARKWIYCQYDNLNRIISSGLITDSTYYNDFAYHCSHADTSIAWPYLANYTSEQLSKTYYDDYTWRPGESNPLTDTISTSYHSYLLTPSNTNWPYPQSVVQSGQLRELVTGTKTKVLGSANTYLYEVNFYDEKERLIQTKATNLTTGTDINTTQFSFFCYPVINVIKNEKSTPNDQATIALTKITYDSLARIIKTEKKISNSKVNNGNMPGSWTKVSENEYDALGQLRKKKIGMAPLDSIIYDYNIRGWLLGANRTYTKDTTSTANWFGYDLGYDKATFTVNGSSKSYTTAQFNGIIGGMLWKSNGDKQLRKYDFTYDTLDRLASAGFTQLTNNSFSLSAGIDFSVSGLNYDANGNILNMCQKGWKVGGSITIDSLLYTYIPNSNKLLNVIDRKNDSLTTLGDFRSSRRYMVSLSNNKDTAATDYAYDPNGNLTIDKNKDISAITYNHLNLPDSVMITGKGKIKYTYDASGNKLKKVTTDSTISPVKITTTLYMFGNYVNDTLQFLPHEEGRVRYDTSNSSLNYDYFIKDHLGNVRLVLTEQKDTAVYPIVAFEDGSISNESIYYENVDVERTARPGSFYSSGTNGDKVQLLRKSTHAIGALKLLKVMAKDRLHIKVDYYATNDATDNNNANGLSSILTSLTGLLNNNNVTGGFHGFGSTVTGELNNNVPFTDFLAPQGSGSSSMPKAYLNVLFFDEQFRFVSQNSEIIQITTKGSGQHIYRIDGDAKEAAKNGYAYVFVSNESNNLVYFDNLQIIHERGPLTEESHYYPFGLTMNALCSRALSFGDPENKNEKFQDQIFEGDIGLNWASFKWRSHDPQIGRFLQIDPLSSKYMHNSTYAFSENKVTTHIELEGLEAWNVNNDQGGISVVNGPFADQLAAQQYYNQNFAIQGAVQPVGSDGFILGNRIVRHPIPKTAKGQLRGVGGIILHRTVSSSATSTFNTFINSKKGVHFVIDQDGTIYQLAGLHKYTIHIYEGKQKKGYSFLHNWNTIGIEHVGNYNNETKEWDPISEEMARSSAWLVNSLMATYHLTRENIFVHEQIQKKTAGEGGNIFRAISNYLYFRFVITPDPPPPPARPDEPPPRRGF